MLFFLQRKIIFNFSSALNKPEICGLKGIVEVNILTKDYISLLSWYSTPKLNKPKERLFIDEAMHNNLYEFGIENEVIKFNNDI